MDFLKNSLGRLFKPNSRSDILMNDEEEEQFFNKQSEKDAFKQNSTFTDEEQNNSENRKSSQKRRQTNYFDRDRLSMREVQEYLERAYEKNKAVLEKMFILIIILALAIVLIGMSLLLASTFNTDNIERKTSLLDDDVIKPVNDMRNGYKLLTLSNQLQVLIIENNSTQFSSVSLDINVGSWLEPQQVPGLAHLLEHMTLIQSQKYNSSYYFDSFLSVNGGYTDAFTSFDHTNFFFTVRSAELEKAIDIFAHMFIDPIYNIEIAKKESSVVESEFKISQQNDDLKIRHLLTILSVPSHPFSRFTAGNVKSLRDNFDIDIVEELEKFRTSYYSSNLMKLVVFTDQSIEKIEQIILPFQEIQNNFMDKPNFGEQQKPIKNTKKLIKLRTLDENEVFYMVFQIDLDQSQYRKRPIEFISFFLNNYMDGGLKNYLQDELDLIFDLEVSKVLDQENYSIFYVKFMMQNGKVKQFETVVKSFMNYLQFIKQQGLKQQIYQERAIIANLTFSYNANTILTQEDVSNYAWNLNEYDYKEVFAADSIWKDSLDKQLVEKVIDQMMDFENIILVAGSSNFSNTNKDQNLKEEDIEELEEVEKKDDASENTFIQTKQTEEEDENDEIKLEDETIDTQTDFTKEFEMEFKQDMNSKNQYQYLENDDFDNIVPLYDIHYSEKDLTETQISKMSELDELLIEAAFSLQYKNEYIPTLVFLEDICTNNQMTIDYTNIDLSAQTLPDPNSTVCLYSPYVNPTRKFTNFNFTQLESTSLEASCDAEAYIDKYQKHPSLIKYENGIEGWYKFDLFYKAPQVIGYFNILFQDRFETPKDVIKGKIIAKVFESRVEELLGDAIDAGFIFEITSQYSSLTLKTIGWSESFSNVVLQLFKIWKQLDISKEDYENAFEQVKEETDNYRQWDAVEQGRDYFLKKAMLEEFIDPKIELKLFEKIKYEDVLKHAKSERYNSKLIAMLIGNIQSSKAQNLLNQLDKDIVFSKSLQEYSNVYGVFDIDALYYIKEKTIGVQQDLNRAIVSFYQIDKRNAITITEGRIVTRMLKQFIYNNLVKEKQYIYEISTEIVSFGALDGIQITLMADKISIVDMQYHLQDAINEFYSQLPLVLESEFSEIQQAELGVLNSSPLTLRERADYLWKQLNQFNYVFDEQDILISQLYNTTKEDILAAFETIFVKSPKAIHVQVHNFYDPIGKYNFVKDQKQKDNNVKVITNIFKQMKNRDFNKFAGEIL